MLRALTLILLLCATSAVAADIAAVVAPMKTEAEECRYLLNLCAREAKLQKAFTDMLGGTNLDQATGKGEIWHEAALEVVQAADLIRGKHATKPKCFDRCSTLKGSTAFD